MQESKKLLPGTIVTIKGGHYDGQGAQIRKVNRDKRTVAVMIAGKIRNLIIERVTDGKN